MNWDIELEAGWTEQQVHEQVRMFWAKEIDESPTQMETRDALDKLDRFAVNEWWTYILLDQDVLGLEWARRLEYNPAKRRGKGDEAVLIGIQVEGGQRHEMRVRADTLEIAPKTLMAKELHLMKPRCFLHIQGASGQTEESFAIRWQWTYSLNAKPREQQKTWAKHKQVDVRLRAPGMFERCVNARSDWSEQLALIEFKKPAGVCGPMGLKVTDAGCEAHARFGINAAFTYQLVSLA
jgi:hypothetical protein